MVSGDRPGLRRNPRTREYDRAARALAYYVSALEGEYALTDVETAKMLAELAALKLTYVLHAERYPRDAERRPSDAALTAWIENNPREFAAWVDAQRSVGGPAPGDPDKKADER